MVKKNCNSDYTVHMLWLICNKTYGRNNHYSTCVIREEMFKKQQKKFFE